MGSLISASCKRAISSTLVRAQAWKLCCAHPYVLASKRADAALSSRTQTCRFTKTVRIARAFSYCVPTNLPAARAAGFHSDLNETYPVGRVDDDSLRLMRTARKCLDEAIKLCKPGALFRDLGKTMCVPSLPSSLAYARR